MFNENFFFNVLLFKILITFVYPNGEMKTNCQIYSESQIHTCFNFDYFSFQYINKSINKFGMSSLYFKLKKEQVLKREFVFLSLKIFEQAKLKNLKIMFSHLKGIESSVFNKESKTFDEIDISLIFYDSKLIIFNSEGKVEKCQSYHDTNSSLNLSTLQFSFGSAYGLVCPLFFNHLNVNLLSIDYLTNTFYKKNLISFFNITMNYPNIFRLNLFYCENLILKEEFLNKNIFKSLNRIQIIGKLSGIEENLLGKLEQLTLLQLDIYFARSLFAQGIRWTKSVNKNSKNRVFTIQISHREFPFADSDYKINTLFPDHDFCIYKNFPFENKVVLDVSDGFIYQNFNFTCTFNYIRFKNSKFNSNFVGFYSKLYPNEKHNCDFEKIIKNCQIKILIDKQNLKEFIVFTEFMFVIILNPLASFIALLLNLSVIILLKNVKISKPNLFFIKCYSFVSFVFIILKLLSLINQCSFKTGIFCSSIRSKIMVQYYKKFIVDFLCEILKFLLNFLLISYNYYRFRFLTNSKFSLTLTKMKLIFFFFLAFSLLINWSNIMHSRINYSLPNLNYPISSLNSENVLEPPKIYLKYLNALSKLINYVLFFIFNILIDFLIIRKLRKIIKFKAKFKSIQNYTKNDQLNKINLSILKKTMSNLVINLVLKTPEFFPIFYSFTFFATESQKNLNFTQFEIFVETILIKYGLEALFEKICELAFILSIINNFYFYFVSNKYLKDLYKQKIFQAKKQKN